MEALGAAAGAIGIASFGIQILHSVKRLSEFCSSVKNVPEKLKELLEELEGLASILAKCEDDGSQGYRMARESCQKASNDVSSVMQSLQKTLRGRKIHQTWSAVKATLKGKELNEAFTKLERSKQSLALAQQAYGM